MYNKLHLSFVLIFCAVALWSGINPADRFTWYLETVPAFIGAALAVLTYKKFRFTNLSYFFILFFCVLLLIGGKYTYAEVPLFNWIRDYFHLSRNHFDRFGHFFQGVIPAILAREILLRKTGLKKGKMLFFVCVCVAMFVSSGYELIEWIAAEILGHSAEDFLGLQGDEWDAQKDMFMALCGSITVQLIFSKFQDKQIKKIEA